MEASLLTIPAVRRLPIIARIDRRLVSSSCHPGHATHLTIVTVSREFDRASGPRNLETPSTDIPQLTYVESHINLRPGEFRVVISMIGVLTQVS